MKPKENKSAIQHSSPVSRNYFVTAPSPPPILDFKLVRGGSESCEAGSRFQRDANECLGLEFILFGKGTLTSDKESFSLMPGQLILHKRGCKAVYTVSKKTPLAKCWLEFKGTEAEKIFEEVAQARPRPAILPQFPSLRDLFEQILRMSEQAGDHTQRAGNCLLEVLLLEIKNSFTAKPLLEASPAFQSYQRCLQQLKDGFRHIGSAAELARKAYVNPTYLYRLFSRFDDEQPYRKLLRFKMEHAAKLLNQGEMLIKEISNAVGFEDPLHFSRLFKRHYGHSPRAFRQQQIALFHQSCPSGTNRDQLAS